MNAVWVIAWIMVRFVDRFSPFGLVRGTDVLSAACLLFPPAVSFPVFSPVRFPGSARSAMFGLAAWMCLLCPSMAEAAPGIRLLLERGTHDRGLYERMEEDMRVKVRTETGHVRVVRLWTGGEWKWDARWANLRLHGVPPEADGEEGKPAHAAYWVELGGVAYAWEKEARQCGASGGVGACVPEQLMALGAP